MCSFYYYTSYCIVTFDPPPPHPTLIKEASLSVLDEADESSDEFTSSQPVQLAPPVHHSEDEVDSGAESHDDTQKKNPAPVRS